MKNITPLKAHVTRSHREKLNGHRSVLLWFTGLSGAGKSTLAHALEERLHEIGCRTFVMDGDNVRFGLCSDLNFSNDDRKENIRRIAEASKLMVEAGILTMTAFISPFRAERLKARQLFPHGDFIEVYCSTPIQVCEARDVKGLYQRARAGEVLNFTGISSPYEPPIKPELLIDTSTLSLADAVQHIVDYLAQQRIIQPNT